MRADAAKAIIDAVASWAARRDDIRALALVGSWARGDEREDSDVDLLLLTERADAYGAETEWLAGIDLAGTGHRVRSWKDAAYGVIHSWHIELVPAADVELSFARCAWAATGPVDEGTCGVVRAGFRIILLPCRRTRA